MYKDRYIIIDGDCDLETLIERTLKNKGCVSMKDERVQNKLNLFQQAIKNNRLSHLYLISGLKGSGKRCLHIMLRQYF